MTRTATAPGAALAAAYESWSWVTGTRDHEKPAELSRWTSPDGHTVEVITLSGTGSADRDGQWLRVTRRAPAGRLLVGQVRTPAELAGLGVDLAALTEDSDLTLAA